MNKFKQIFFFVFILFFGGCKNENSEWKKIQNSDNIEDYKFFLENYKQSHFTDDAKRRINKIEKTNFLKRYYNIKNFTGEGYLQEFLTETPRADGGIDFIQHIILKMANDSSYTFNYVGNDFKVINEFKRDTTKINTIDVLYQVRGYIIEEKDEITADSLELNKKRILEIAKNNPNMKSESPEKYIKLSREYEYLLMFSNEKKSKKILADTLIFIKYLKPNK